MMRVVTSARGTQWILPSLKLRGFGLCLIRVAVGVGVWAVVGCGPAMDATDADVGTADADSTVIARGAVGLIGPTWDDLDFGSDFSVCAVEPPGGCDLTDAGGRYALRVPPRSNITLRMTSLVDDTLLPALRPIASGTVDFSAVIFAIPRPELAESLLTPVGGWDPSTEAVAIVYIQGSRIGTGFAGSGAPGYSVTLDGPGSVHYLSDALGIDPAQTVTTTAGIVVITDIAAPAWSDTTPPHQIRVVVNAPTDGLCAVPDPRLGWIEGTPRAGDPSYASIAPVYAGHVTYAAYLACP